MKIPDGWAKVKFGDVVNKINDKVPNREEWSFDKFIGGEHFDEGEIRVTRSAPIAGNEEVIGSAFHMRFKPGHVLYVTRNPRLRKGGMVDFEGVCSNVSFVMQTDETKLLQSLLPFIIQTEDFVKHTNNNAHGSTNPFLNWKDIAKYEFILSPLEEQKKISEALWAIEENIKYLEIYLDKFKKYKKRMHIKLYTDLNTKFILFKEIIQLKKGKKPQFTYSEKKEGCIPYINTDYLRIGRINSYATPDNKIVLIEDEDIILLWDGSNAGEILTGKKGILSSTMAKIFFDDKKYDKQFVYYFLSLYESHIKMSCQGTGIPHIDRIIIEKLKFPILDLKKQKEIYKVLVMLDKYEDRIICVLKNSRNFRNKFSNELLSGKLKLGAKK